MRRKHTPSRSGSDDGWEPAQITIDGKDITEYLTEKGEPRRKPGTKSTEDWDLRLAAWLGQISCSEPKRFNNVAKLANDAADFLQEQINWAPQPERTARKIRQIRQFLGL